MPLHLSCFAQATFALASRADKVHFASSDPENRIEASSVRAHRPSKILLVLRLSRLFIPTHLFLPLSFVSLLAGVAWAIPYLLRHQGLTVASMLLLVTSGLLFALGPICDQVARLRLERYE